jgi:hypothetical protein
MTNANPKTISSVSSSSLSSQQQRTTATFSACLLTMDDNHALPEWIAYHYYALSLRYLVVAVDPYSRTRPTAVLDRWRRQKQPHNDEDNGIGGKNDSHRRPHGRNYFQPMTILEWSDEDFTTTSGNNSTMGMNLARDGSDTVEVATRKHRHRQSLFYRKCAQHMQQHNRSWTAFLDVDEFLTVNRNAHYNHTRSTTNYNDSNSGSSRSTTSIDARQNDDWEEVPQIAMSRPGGVLDLILHYSSAPPPPSRNNSTRRNAHANESTTTAFPVAHWYDRFEQNPCVSIARVMFSVVNSTHEQVSKDVPLSVVNPIRLDTLRYRYRLTAENETNGRGKSIIDVSKLGRTISDTDPAGTAHRPLSSCPHALNGYNSLPVGIHHHLGSWEVYDHRQDARRGWIKTRDKWLDRASGQRGGSDDEIRPWIQGFVDLVGPETAVRLLAGAGELGEISPLQP